MSRKKNVLMVTRLFYPHLGGVEKHVYRISEELLRKNYSVTILTARLADTEKLQNHKGIKIVRINTLGIPLLGLLYIWMQIILKIKLFIKSDFMHIHDVFIWILPIRLMLIFKKIYLTMHGWEGVYPIPLKNILLKKLASKFSNGTISIGRYIDIFYGTKSNYVLHGAVDKYTIFKKNKGKIVFLGRLSKDTGLLKAIEIIRKMKYKQVFFVGDGPLRNKCLGIGTVTGFSPDPLKYTKDAEFIFASGYLTVLEGLVNKSKVVVTFDNKLKKSYFEETPFKSFITSGESSDNVLKKLKSAESKVGPGYKWASQQTWEKLTNTYLKLWDEL